MSLADLPKAYDPQDAQARWYAFWLEKGYFHADSSSEKPPYTIVIPPPNVTGALHLGHALNNTIQDILIRWHRMRGFETLWMPGTDHAGIATQAVVERRLMESEKKTRHDLGREALVERIWAWKDEYEARILGQLRLMGCSCDWDRTRFTLDETCARAVRVTFFNLFRADKIFRGKRLVNWDAQLRTAVADDEIYYEDVQGQLWTIAYPVEGDGGESLHVATTRPETMLGDTAVAVHPDDPRYRHLIGRNVVLPLTGRSIPIIGDAILVDPKFGTGCVKVTPAHDPNDYQTGLRHDLPRINLLNPDGTFNENAGPYAGLDRKVVRKRVLADLEASGSLVKTEAHANRVGYSDRSKTPIEPYLSDQWFVRMADDADGNAGLAQIAMDAVTSGRVAIHPERYVRSYLDWLAEKRDWCISRQLWWGHRIPVWSRTLSAEEQGFNRTTLIGQGGDTKVPASYSNSAFDSFNYEAKYRVDEEQGSITVSICPADMSEEDLVRFEKAAAAQGFFQDPDVLDTWFSSALWPHSTLGWPEPTPELKKFYPTSVLSTARDIITLWVARMVIFGEFNVGEVPFKDVFIHPVIQDGNGKRMSKSAGNGIDPVDIVDSYGADALRFTLASAVTETQDLRMPVEPVKNADGKFAVRPAPGEPIAWVDAATLKDTPKDRIVNTSERFELGRTFPNKFWNAARFALMNLEGYEPGPIDPAGLPVEDRWILSLLARTTAEVSRELGSFAFADAARRLRDFTWNDFCDWYVEFAKARLRDPEARPVAQRVVAAMLDGLCRLLHPIVPFVTEQVWQALGGVAPARGIPAPAEAEESVCIAAWPDYPSSWHDAGAEATVAQWREKVSAIRNLRAERSIPPSAKVAPIIVAADEVAAVLREGETHIKVLVNASSLTIADRADRPEDCAVAVLPDAEIIVPLEGLVDRGAEAARHRKALGDIDKQLVSIRAKLGNEGFVARAKPEVVEAQRAKEAELLTQRAAVAALLGE